VAEQESLILREHGHEIVEYRRSNSELGDDLASTMLFAARAVWSPKAEREITAIIRRHKPDVAHFHNVFPQISPSGYRACLRLGIPVIQTVHNYRMTCVRGDYFRNNRVCETCLTWKVPLPALLHSCYRNSTTQTIVAAAALAIHQIARTWNKMVDIFLVLTNFSAGKLIEAGLPSEKIFVKPNCVYPDPLFSEWNDRERQYALFVGRLFPERRVRLLLEVWRSIREIPLLIVGSGSGWGSIRSLVARERLSNVHILDGRPRAELLSLMKHARMLLVPSEWYETFGMVMIEAFACGTPVFASRLGAMAEIVEPGTTGMLFTPGSAEEIRKCVEWAAGHPKELGEMGHNARQVFEEKYNAETNYLALMQAYQKAKQMRAF
jgi:glycosyltransferase involved in cell wall biosynthesis